MRRNFSFYTLVAGLAVSAFVSSCHTQKVASTQGVSNRSIVVLYDNDVHCNVSGYSKFAGLRDAVSDTADVAMVSCGDYLQGGTTGAISRGQYVVDVMRSVGYDAVTLGNHEFDYGIEPMFKLLESLKAPVTCVNLRDMQGKGVLAPYVMKKVGGKNIAFVGVVTPGTLRTEAYSFYDEEGKQMYDLAAKDVYSLVQKSADEARKKGADYVIVLSHLGEDPTIENVDSHGLIKATRGIDVVLDGHTHNVVPALTVNNIDGKPVYISQTGTKFWNVGKLVINREGKISTEMVNIKNLTRVNQDVQNVIDSVEALSKAITSRPICESEVDLVILDAEGRQRVRVAETNAGDIVADAFRDITGAEIGVTNGGGIRTEVKAGSLTYGDMVSLLPYENYVCMVEITGKELKEMLNAVTATLPLPSGDFPQVSGIKFVVNVGKEDRITNLEVQNKESGKYEPIVMDKTYTLATTDYCITGGGMAGKLKNNKVLLDKYIVYNECLIKYVTEKLNSHIGQEYAKPQGRITVKQ